MWAEYGTVSVALLVVEIGIRSVPKHSSTFQKKGSNYIKTPHWYEIFVTPLLALVAVSYGSDCSLDHYSHSTQAFSDNKDHFS